MAIDFATAGLPPQPDGRLNAPAFHRNHVPIWSVLAQILGGRHGDVLELGSGSGQHVVAFADRSPDIVWWPSDVDVDHLRPACRIDLSEAAWTPGADAPAQFAMILSINVLHISPWRVAENLVAGSARRLAPDGHLCVYGPFRRGGRHTAASNAAFDVSLRRQNPEWGVRDVDDLAKLARDAGFALADVVEMPANNLTLRFIKL